MLFGLMLPSRFGTSRPPRRVPGRRRSVILRNSPRVETLDARQLFAVVSPSVVMASASTADSQGVTITYNVEAARTTPITLGFYRSADSSYSTDDVPVASVLALPSADSSGASTTSVGTHTVTVPITGGLPLNPEHPYVLAVANPVASEAGDIPSTASFRKHTIGVITHGGIQDTAWQKNGPPWTLQMRRSLLAEGYDEVIVWNWVAASSTPGSAVKQAPRLAQRVLETSATFPVTDPVDIHFIGHSEGTVINAQAIVAASAKPTPQLQAGYWEDTILDPHAANPDFAGRQYSVSSGLIGAIAKTVIDNFQARARDPLVFVPDRINQAQVFYQQTPANRDHGQNNGIYNLWGQVPVRGATRYFNLTPSGIVHGGNNGVYRWYQYNIVPQLGDGAPQVRQAALTGAQISTTTGGASVATSPPVRATPATVPVAPAVDPSNPTYAGYAQPGVRVLVRASRPNSNKLQTIAVAQAAPDGTWKATVERDLAPGQYRVVASSRISGPVAGRRPVYATTPLGPLVVNATYRE